MSVTTREILIALNTNETAHLFIEYNSHVLSVQIVQIMAVADFGKPREVAHDNKSVTDKSIAEVLDILLDSFDTTLN